MTTEEAIRTLEYGAWWDFLANEITDAEEKPFHEALNMAIAALREQRSEAKCVEIDTVNKTMRAKPMTNADRIRAMSDEELSDLFIQEDIPCKFAPCFSDTDCKDCILT